MRRDVLIAFLLATLTLGVFWPVRNHDFIAYDDPQFVTENAQIQSGLSWKTVVYAFAEPIAGNWHPVTSLSHALDCDLFGVNAGAHHLVNALIHALNAALLFLALQQLSRASGLRLGGDEPSSIDKVVADVPRRSDKQSSLPHNLRQVSSYTAVGRNAIVAALFAWHPLRVESVAWLAERKDLLAGFFFLLTLWFYAGYVGEIGEWKSGKRESANAESEKPQTGKAERGKAGRRKLGWGLYLGSLLCFGLGLMSKPMVVTLPFVLLLLDYWPLKRLGQNTSEGRVPRVPIQKTPKTIGGALPRRRYASSDFKSQISNLPGLVYEKIPFFLLSAAACWVTLRVQKSAGAMQAIQGITWPERLANAITSYVRYLGKLFWPSDLAVIYPHPAKHYFLTDAWPSWEVGLAALLLLLISLFCVVQLRRRPCLAVGWCWFLGTLVPVIGLVQVGEQAIADRYTYIPMIGVVMALVWGMSELGKADVARIFNLLYRRIPFCPVREQPSVPRFEVTTAPPPREQFERIGAGRRETWTAGCGLGAMLALLVVLTRHQLGFWQSTVTLFDHTISVTADNPSAHFALGVGLEHEGQVGKAMVQYRVAVAIDPHYAKAYYNMGQVLRKAGIWQPAAQAYLSAARCNPTDLATQLNLASVLPHLDRTREAIAHFNRALEMDPNSVEGLNNLAWLLCTSPGPGLRDGARAVQLAERACSLTGFKTPVFLGTLAAAYAEAGRFAEAVATAQRAAALAAETGDSATAAKNRELSELYRANKPYRDAE